MKLDKHGYRTNHDQVTCRGIVTATHKPFSFLCDRGVLRVLKELNEAGVVTLYSCQGNDPGSWLGPYLVFKNKGAKNAICALSIIERHWKRYWVRTEVSAYNGNICVRAYRNKQCLLDCTRTSQEKFE